MSAPGFQIVLWPHRLLVLAPAFASARHRHHAVQIALGLEGPTVYEAPGSPRLEADLLLIPPDLAHANPAYGAAALLYLEPESSDWIDHPAHGKDVLTTLPFEPALRVLARRAAAGDLPAAQALADEMLGKREPSGMPIDPLVEQVCRTIRQGLAGPVTLAALASGVHRSPSRLAHRFRQATGVPLRRYVLWCRLRAAIEAAMHGASLTEAAHAAGFADSAHLSRTFRAMFGIVPSSLFEHSRVRLVSA